MMDPLPTTDNLQINNSWFPVWDGKWILLLCRRNRNSREEITHSPSHKYASLFTGNPNHNTECYLVKYYLYFPSSWKVILLVLGSEIPQVIKTVNSPQQETLHRVGLENTQVTVASWVGSSHHPRWDGISTLTSKLLRHDEILTSRVIRCRAQPSWPHTCSCLLHFSYWLIMGMSHTSCNQNFPRQHLILLLIIKQTFF